VFVDLDQATEAPVISLQIASRDREGLELTHIMKPCRRQDLRFVAGEKTFATPRPKKSDKQIGAELGGTAVHIETQRQRITEAVVWTLIYLKP
jgi:hypothetical protein